MLNMVRAREVIAGGDRIQSIIGQMATEGIGPVGNQVGDRNTQTRLTGELYAALEKKRPTLGRAGGVRIVDCELYPAHSSYFARAFWPPLRKKK